MTAARCSRSPAGCRRARKRRSAGHRRSAPPRPRRTRHERWGVPAARRHRPARAGRHAPTRRPGSAPVPQPREAPDRGCRRRLEWPPGTAARARVCRRGARNASLGRALATATARATPGTPQSSSVSARRSIAVAACWASSVICSKSSVASAASSPPAANRSFSRSSSAGDPAQLLDALVGHVPTPCSRAILPNTPFTSTPASGDA